MADFFDDLNEAEKVDSMTRKSDDTTPWIIYTCALFVILMIALK
jgi:hypothetical protein